MLHDTERNQKYYDALRDAVKLMHQKGKPAIVLDIGTGKRMQKFRNTFCKNPPKYKRMHVHY